MVKYTCELCNILVDTCKDLGDGKYCEELINDYKAKKITEDEFFKKVEDRFGKDFFDKMHKKG